MYKYCVVVVLVQLLYAAVLKLLSSYDNNLQLWANKWLMMLNVNKCEVLHISLKQIIKKVYLL